MTKAREITVALDALFAEFDAVTYEENREWGVRRAAAVRDFRNSPEYAEVRRAGQAALYARLFAIAGGKTWYNLFSGRSDAMIREAMDTHTARTIAGRNATIAAKLEKAGIAEVVSAETARTSDGFNGRFVVETDKGRKVVTIETIVAGGYNIQCRHLRVLVRIK